MLPDHHCCRARSSIFPEGCTTNSHHRGPVSLTTKTELPTTVAVSPLPGDMTPLLTSILGICSKLLLNAEELVVLGKTLRPAARRMSFEPAFGSIEQM